MQFKNTPFNQLLVIEPFRHIDLRGEFVKTYHAEQFQHAGLRFELREEFFSVSKKDVLRGMHFQTPPFEHQKCIYCTQGNILDVVLDLRKNEPTYGKCFSIELSALNRLMLWIPIGFAHGFLSLTEESCVIYKTDREHAPSNDMGIRWNSFGFDWQVDAHLLKLSARDLQLPPFDSLQFPF